MCAKKVGRNDPCPCGSGKKYKHCCLRKDQQRRRTRVASSSSPVPQRLDGLISQVRHLTGQLDSRIINEDRGLRENLERIEELATFEAMRDDIDAASRQLEDHRDAFEAMMADPPSAMERALSLFAEEPFVPLRYSPDDVQRAFEEVGYPSLLGEMSGREDGEKMVAASLHLAGDEDQRVRVSRQLMMTMPEYVEAGRYRDAWLIQHSAYLMAESTERSNPFLFSMVQFAQEAWVRQAEREQRELMREIGVDVSALRRSGIHEIDAAMERLMADPDKKARLDAFYEAHPGLRDQAAAGLMHLDRQAFKLLEREDAEPITLSPQEVAPWLEVLMERLAPQIAQFRKDAQRDEAPDPDAIQAMRERMFEMTQEMAPEVFTMERIEWLRSDLQDYQRRLSEAGEREAATLAHGAMTSLRDDLPPADNPFLVGLCFISLRGALQAAAEDAEGQEAGG